MLAKVLFALDADIDDVKNAENAAELTGAPHDASQFTDAETCTGDVHRKKSESAAELVELPAISSAARSRSDAILDAMLGSKAP